MRLSKTAMTHVIPALALLLSSSCQAPTEPAPSALAATSATHIRREPLDAFDDMTGRILPSLSDRFLAADIELHLQAFAAAYEAGDDVEARQALERMHKRL